MYYTKKSGAHDHERARVTASCSSPGRPFPSHNRDGSPCLHLVPNAFANLCVRYPFMQYPEPTTPVRDAGDPNAR